MEIVRGCIAAPGQGGADFMARGVRGRIGTCRALWYAHLVSFIGLPPSAILDPPLHSARSLAID